MERVCLVGQVRAERLTEHQERHEAVWPVMLAALREAGWSPDQGFQRIGEIFHLG